jgi:hypothetical protein
VTAALEAALSYAEDGMLVLPLHWPLGHGCSCRKPGCEHPGKHPFGPAVPNGKDSATRDVDRIRDWWKRWPAANIGIRPAVGMVVLDVDPRNGGEATLRKLQMANGALPETLTATTGSGGAHVWYAAPKVTAGKLGAGLDVKTERGYLVAAPSIHVSGGVYRWTTEAPIVSAPRWLCQLLAPPPALRTFHPRARGAGDRGAALVRTVAAAQRGNRNNLLWWAARKAYEAGGDPELLAEIRQAAIAGGQAATAVDATIRSAEQRAKAGGRQ